MTPAHVSFGNTSPLYKICLQMDITVINLVFVSARTTAQHSTYCDSVHHQYAQQCHCDKQ